MVFTQIWYLHKQALQDQNKGFTNCAEFTLQWRNYPIWRYLSKPNARAVSRGSDQADKSWIPGVPELCALTESGRPLGQVLLVFIILHF